MPTGAGKSAGRVSVRVVPDSTGFRSELKADLDKIERGLEIQVKAALDDTKLKADLDRLRSMNVSLDVKLNSATAKAEIEKVGRSGRKVELPVSLSGQQIVRAELIRLAANRVVDLVININKRSLVAAGSALASLSGGKNAVGYLRGIGSALSNLDKSVPKIALVAASVGSVGALGLSSVGGLLSLASSLTAVAGAGLAVPGLLAGLGVAGGTLAIALTNVGDQLGDLTPKFQAFQLAISKNFFAVAEGPIRDLVATTLPALETGLGRVSTSLGGFAAAAATSLGNAVKAGALGPLFDNTAAAIDNAKTAIQPLVAVFSTLVTFGSTYLPSLGSAIGSLAGKFNGFIQSAAADGSLKDWADSGLAALKSLGSVVGSVAGIVKGLFDAANAGTGGNGLTVFAGALQQVSAAINSSGLQTALSTIFTGASAGASGLAAAIKPIGALFQTLAPQIAGALEAAGTVVGQALGGIASALSQPAVAKGLTSLFAGITTGVNAILPVLPTLGQAFGTVLQTLGQVAAQLGPVFAASFAAIAPVVTTLLTALQPLIPIIGAALADSVSILAVALQALAPVFAAVLTAVAPLIPVLAGALAGAIVALAPAILQVVQAIGGSLPGVIAAIASSVAILAPLVAQLITGLAPLLPTILALVPALLQIGVAFLSQLLPGITALLPQIIAMAPLFAQILAAVLPLAAPLGQLVVSLLQLAVVVQAQLLPVFPLFVSALQVVVGGLQGLLGIITGFVQGAVALFSGNFAAIPGIIQGIFGRVLQVFGSGLAGPAGLLQAFVSNGIQRVVAFGAGIVSAVSSALSSFVAKISSAISQAVSLIGSLPGKAKSALGNLAGIFVSVGGDIIRGIIQGISNGVGALVNAITNAAKSALNAAKSALGINSPSRVFANEVGRHIPTGVAQGIQASQGQLDAALSSMVNPALAGLSAARVASPALVAGGGGRSGDTFNFGDVVGHNINAIVDEIERRRNFRDMLAAAQGWS